MNTPNLNNDIFTQIGSFIANEMSAVNQIIIDSSKGKADLINEIMWSLLSFFDMTISFSIKLISVRLEIILAVILLSKEKIAAVIF